MKKSILLAFFALISVTAFSQISWNAKVGMNISNCTGDMDLNSKVGFKIGGGMEYSFNDVWGLQPSLFFSTKGAKEDNMTINAMYLELPVMAAARLKVTDNTNIVISAGPYFAYGVGGKTSVEESGVEVSVDTFGDEGMDLDRFDAGLGVGVAAEFGKIIVGLDGQFGLVDVTSVKGAGNPKNLNFSISVGYKF